MDCTAGPVFAAPVRSVVGCTDTVAVQDTAPRKTFALANCSHHYTHRAVVALERLLALDPDVDYRFFVLDTVALHIDSGCLHSVPAARTDCSGHNSPAAAGFADIDHLGSKTCWRFRTSLNYSEQ